MRSPRFSLLYQIWLSIAVVLTALGIFTGLGIQQNLIETTTRSLREEVKASFQAYESVWKAREDILASAGAILRNLPDVRAAFGTRDGATIRDKAAELSETFSAKLRESAFFVVTSPDGVTVANFDERSAKELPRSWPVVITAQSRFPKQLSGFFLDNGRLFHLVLTPVYVASGRGKDLIAVLVAGYVVDGTVAQELKRSTGGSEFLFYSADRVFGSTLPEARTAALVRNSAAVTEGGFLSDNQAEYAQQIRDLVDLGGKPVGKIAILRSFEGARASLQQMLRARAWLVFLSSAIGLAFTYFQARRIVKPIQQLDEAARKLGQQQFDARVTGEVTDRGDEIGRLGRTFNTMADSLASARNELIRQERISTIGRMASSIVHDLRNPLAAIYSGAEMLVDSDLTPTLTKRLAGNIYQASRRSQEMLQDLLNVARGKSTGAEMCLLDEVISAAAESSRQRAEAKGVSIAISVAPGVELPLQRSRMERVFMNLIGNAIEAAPAGGRIGVSGGIEGESAVARVADSGPGIAEQIRANLFQPFVTHGKKNGLGLGLALSRQTVLDHGGDMWAEPSKEYGGACFCLRLPAGAGIFEG